MNYILHLNNWLVALQAKEEAKPTHISLYLALFNHWNKQRFADRIFVTRFDLMEMSKIGSNTTYSNCMSALHEWGWIYYSPSNSTYAKSEVRMYDWSKNEVEETAVSSSKRKSNKRTSTGHVVEHNIQTNIKHNKPFLNQTKQEKKDTTTATNTFKTKYHEPL